MKLVKACFLAATPKGYTHTDTHIDMVERYLPRLEMYSQNEGVVMFVSKLGKNKKKAKQYVVVAFSAIKLGVEIIESL